MQCWYLFPHRDVWPDSPAVLLHMCSDSWPHSQWNSTRQVQTCHCCHWYTLALPFLYRPEIKHSFYLFILVNILRQYLLITFFLNLFSIENGGLVNRIDFINAMEIKQMFYGKLGFILLWVYFIFFKFKNFLFSDEGVKAIDKCKCWWYT